MSSEEFIHSDSYKAYVNSALQSFPDKSVSDHVWGSRIPSSYEELKQHCSQFIDKWSALPLIQSESIIKPFVPAFSSAPQTNFRDLLINNARVRYFKSLLGASPSTLKEDEIQSNMDHFSDAFQEESEAISSMTEDDINKKKLQSDSDLDEHNNQMFVLSEYISFFPYIKAAETTSSFVKLFAESHPPPNQFPRGLTPPIMISDEASIASELGRLSSIFGLSQSDLQSQINKLYNSSAESSISWNSISISEDILDPSAQAFKLFASCAHVSMESENLPFVPSHRQTIFSRTFSESFAGKSDAILSGEESFLHTSSIQVLNQRAASGQAGLLFKLKYLRTQNLRRSVMSIANWSIFALKNMELDVKDIQDKSCLEKMELIKRRLVSAESKEFPDCPLIYDCATCRNLIFDEAEQMMELIRADLLNFGSYYIRKSPIGVEIDRKTIVEELFECESTFQCAKKKLIESITSIPFASEDSGRRILRIAKFFVSSRPVLQLDGYTYFKAPYDINSQILECQAAVFRSSHVHSVDDVENILSSVNFCVSTIALKQGTLFVGALVTIELIVWNYVKSVFENPKVDVFAGLSISPRFAEAMASSGQIRSEAVKTAIAFIAYKVQCSDVGKQATLRPNSTTELSLAIDDLKQIPITDEIVTSLQAGEASLLSAVVEENFTLIESRVKKDAISKACISSTNRLYQSYFICRDPPQIQLFTDFKVEIRQPELSFEDKSSSWLKQIQILTATASARSKLIDTLTLASVFKVADFPTSIDPSVDTLQPSLKREKLRSATEFYSLTTFLFFISFGVDSLKSAPSQSLRKTRKLNFPNVFDVSLIPQNETLRSQTVRSFLLDSLMRIEVACLECGLEALDADPSIPPPITDLKVISEPNEVQSFEIIEQQLSELHSIGFSSLHFLFLPTLSQSMRQRIKSRFDSLSSDTQLSQKYRALKQKTLLIRLISSPAFSFSSFPKDLHYLYSFLNNTTKEDGIRFLIIHLFIERCIKRCSTSLPISGPRAPTQKYFADFGPLPSSAKSENISPLVAQFSQSIQLHSSSKFDLNLAKLEFAQNLISLAQSSIGETNEVYKFIRNSIEENHVNSQKEFDCGVLHTIEESETFPRKLQTSISDKTSSITSEITMLEKSLKTPKFSEADMKLRVRRTVREDVAPKVKELAFQLFSLSNNLENYQKGVEQEVEASMFEVKKQAISQLLRSQNLPEEVKDSMRKAFDLDDRIHEAMSTKEELSTAEMKLRELRLLQEFSVRSDFKMKLRRVEEQREEVKQKGSETAETRELKEKALKQKLSIVTQSVKLAQRDEERLKRELELERSNHSKLGRYKEKHEIERKKLEEEAERLTEWSKFDPDRLKLELRETQEEIERSKRTKERSPQLIEKTKVTLEKELRRCRTQLKAHKQVNRKLQRAESTCVTMRSLCFKEEEPYDGKEDNQRLRLEGDELQKRLAELSLQISSVSPVKIGGINVRTSRLSQRD